MNKLLQFFLLAAFCVQASSVAASWHHHRDEAMGTEIYLTFWHEDEVVAEQIIADVMAEMQRIDQTYSPYIETSELSLVNKRAFQQAQPISAEMALLLNTAENASELTQGAFDITYASVGHLYDYRKRQQPDEAEREEKLAAIDYHFVNVVDQTVRFKHKNVVIDLGGLAKGYAADQAIHLLKQYGVESGSISAGGDSRLLGDRQGRPWLVGIKHPRASDEIALTLPLADIAVSTSGDYERYFIDAETGERVHHIINPKSGRSASGVRSVTILGPKGLMTDPLSTGVFVMGVERGLALINRLPEIDAIIIDDNNKVYYSDGLVSPE